MSEIKMYFSTFSKRWTLWHPMKGVLKQAKTKHEILEMLKEYELQFSKTKIN